MKPAKHGRDHHPGGEDPINMQLPYAYASNNASSQVVTTDDELEIAARATNDPTCFSFPTTDPDCICIIKDGLYRVFVHVVVQVGDIAVPRSTYAGVSLFSAGPMGGAGVEFGENFFSLGGGQNQSGVGQVTATSTISKSVLNQIGIAPFASINEADPYRVAAILVHEGTNYTLNGGTPCTFMLERVGDIATVV